MLRKRIPIKHEDSHRCALTNRLCLNNACSQGKDFFSAKNFTQTEENRDVLTLTYHNIMAECRFTFSVEEIVKCENFTLEYLGYNALVPTCSDFLKLLLCQANPNTDFTHMIQKANYYVFKSLFDYTMACFRYSSIALASLMCALDELGYQNFQTRLLELVEVETIPFDLVETL